MTLKTDDFDIETYSDSDDGGEVEHKRLLAAISKLDKRKLLPSERREPSLQVSEFHLTKDGSSVNNAVHLRDLAKSLGVKASHGELARKLKAAQRKAKTLPKPLEKPVANKIKREVAYENTIKQLDEWDPVVLKNRVSDNLVFPLKNDKPTKHNPEYFLGPGQGANELEREIAAVLNDSPSVQQEREENEEFSLSLEEMIQRRKELARLKAQESYRLAKAHRQNKIKSKKYHRFARRERIRQQIKEFEELQQKDPEAALQRLEEIEKERVLERASLRHRSTGQWARNQAVRAKYDKESRQVLAEQLKLSKDLTQKVVVESESSDDEPELVIGVHPSDNPWMSEPKTEEEIDTFLSGYRQYWDERNKSEQKGSDVRNLGKELGSINLPEKVKNCGSEDAMEEALLKSAVVSYTEVQGNGIEGLPQPSKLARGSKPQIGIKSSKTRNATSPSSKTKSSITAVGKRGFLKAKQSEPSGIASPSSHKQQNLSQAPRQGEEKKKDKNYVVWTASGKWVVTPTKENNETNANSLDDLFDDLSDKIAGKAKKKLSILMRDINAERPQKDKQSKKNSTKKRKAKNLKASKLLQMKKPRMQVDFDEKLEEGTNVDSNPSNAQNLADIIELSTFKPTENKKSTKSLELDPTKFMKIGPIQLPTELPDEITGGDEGLDDSDTEKDIREKQMTISEAFADDDVVADFRQEKQEAIDKSKPEDISLHLPGWGEWSGFNMKSSNRKRKRFIVKMPEPPPRRDENKGNLIINESEDAAARSHQVSELPFPFTSVKDFEASVRAPVSNTFIPESAHRKLIRPPIRTKIGAVIEPINKDVLMKHKKNVK